MQVLTGEQPDEDWLVNLQRVLALASIVAQLR